MFNNILKHFTIIINTLLLIKLSLDYIFHRLICFGLGTEELKPFI